MACMKKASNTSGLCRYCAARSADPPSGLHSIVLHRMRPAKAPGEGADIKSAYYLID
jgi:hypothetical protein